MKKRVHPAEIFAGTVLLLVVCIIGSSFMGVPTPIQAAEVATKSPTIEPTSAPTQDLPLIVIEPSPTPDMSELFEGYKIVDPSSRRLESVIDILVVARDEPGTFGPQFAAYDPNVSVPIIRGGEIMPTCETGTAFIQFGFKFNDSWDPKIRHPGLDGGCQFGAAGATVVAPFPGLVVASGYLDQKTSQAGTLWISGYVVFMKTILADADGNNPHEYFFGVGHLNGKGMPKVGTFVNSGQKIGEQGGTGYTIPPGAVHQHLFLSRDGEVVNPEEFPFVGTRAKDPVVFGGDACNVDREDSIRTSIRLAKENGVDPLHWLANIGSESNFNHCWEGLPFVKINLELGAIGKAQIYLQVHPNFEPNAVLYDPVANERYGLVVYINSYNSPACTVYTGELRYTCATAAYKGIPELSDSAFLSKPELQDYLKWVDGEAPRLLALYGN